MAYSFSRCVLNINGDEISGFDSGDDTISFAQSVDDVTVTVGNSGTMFVAHNPDKSGTVTFNLQQDSKSNSTMKTLLAAQRAFSGVPIVVNFTDPDNNELIAGANGVIMRGADRTFGAGHNGVTWLITVETLIEV